MFFWDLSRQDPWMAAMKQFNFSLEDLLPHRDRMLLVDEILEVDDKMAVTRATVSDQWPLFDGQDVAPLVLI